jgi:YVTN family beta-propeller protein
MKLRSRFIRAALVPLLAGSIAPLAIAQAATRPIPLGADSVLTAQPGMLFNGWKLTPAGRHVGVNSLPLKMVVSPDGKTLAVVCAGRWCGVALIDLATEQASQWVPLRRTFNGLAFSKDGKTLYVSGGNSDLLYAMDFDGKRLKEEPRAIHLGASSEGGDFLTGLAVDPASGKVYVCNEAASEVWVVDPAAGKVEAKWRTGANPYTCALGADGCYLFVSNWGERSVSAFSLKTGKQVARINVGVRPNEMAVSRDGRMFVACAGDNSVHVIRTGAPADTDRDAKTDASAPPPTDALEILSTSLYESSPEGSTPCAVAVSPDGKSLFVANADNNDVMVADLADHEASRVVGFVPAGWYPSSVATDGKKLFVANGKGLSSSPSFPSTRPSPITVGGIKFDAPQWTLSGSVSVIDPPSPEKLAAYTKQVREDSPYTPETLKASAQPNESVIPSKIGLDCPIKHVLYIIKENRTYDQVLGDMTDAAGKRMGNGDPNLAMFGENITPNQHELARQYVLLDNFYCNAEVSVDGHAWCDLGIANDFNQKQWITKYLKHGTLPGNAELHATIAGAIWDACRRNHVSLKCYGEGAWAVPNADRGTWPDKKDRDMEKVDGWIKDLHTCEKSGKMPQFMIMALPENHTRGTSPGAFTPQSMVASNDIAVGKIVEAFSKSPFWKESAIFIVEDDAQNGPDHVDAHRTVALVVSPFTKRGVVDSTHYTQVSMLRTMELILGLPPLTQYDAAATPMFNAFGKTSQEMPYAVRQPKVDLLAKNEKNAPGAEASARMDFDEVDEAPEDALNRILWAATMGPATPYPVPVHRALFDR